MLAHTEPLSDNADARMGSRRTTVLAALIVCLGMVLVPSDQPQATEVERPSSQVFEAAKPAVVIVQAAEAGGGAKPQ